METPKSYPVLKDQTGWKRWSLWLEAHLRSKGLHRFLDQEQEPPTNENERSKFERQQCEVLALLYRTLDPRLIDLVCTCDTPAKIYVALMENFETTSLKSLTNLLEKLNH